MLSQGNPAMQRVFSMPNYSLIVICFSLRMIEAIVGSHLATKSRLNVKLKINQ